MWCGYTILKRNYKEYLFHGLNFILSEKLFGIDVVAAVEL